MATTPDRFPGTREEEELRLLPESSDPSVVGAIRLISGRFRARDDAGIFDMRTGGSPFDPAAILVDDVLGSILVDAAQGSILVNQ